MKKYLPREDCIELWVLLAQTREAMYKARKKELSRYSISPRQVAVLATIKAIGDKATPAEISRRLVRESHSVGGILDRMEKQGLIRRDKDLERRNLVRVSITEKGQQVYSQVANKESICKIWPPDAGLLAENICDVLSTPRTENLRRHVIEMDVRTISERLLALYIDLVSRKR